MATVERLARKGKAKGHVRPSTRPHISTVLHGIPLRILAPGAPHHLVVTGAGAWLDAAAELRRRGFTVTPEALMIQSAKIDLGWCVALDALVRRH